MVKRLILLGVAALCFFAENLQAAELPRIVVLPFGVFAQKDLSYLKTDIQGAVMNQLKQDGAVVIGPEELSGFSWEEKSINSEAIRSIGIEKGADYVLWGSLTWIGEKFSLDAKLLESFTAKSPDVFFVQGEGVENLFGRVRELAKNVGLKVFKREKIVSVVVTGNRRIETDAIMGKIKTTPGSTFLAKTLSEDLKALYAMGYFDDIRIEAENRAEGKVIILHVKEKATIRNIRITGNLAFDDEEIQKILTIKTGSILNDFDIRSNISRLENMYREKQYHNIQIESAIHQQTQNQADLEFKIKEGVKLRITQISFEGNSAYPEKKLKGIMKTSEKGFFSWLTSSGELNTETLKQDVGRVAAFYHNNGYLQAKVGEPVVEYRKNWIYVTFKIDEGMRFKVGKVNIEGELVLPKEELEKKLKITKEEYYSLQTVRNDVLALNDLYSDEGYAYSDVAPQIDQDLTTRQVHINYRISKGKQVYFEEIFILGNTKTRDKVIRRELKVYEQELYSGVRLKRGIRNLYRLDFFEEVKVDTLKGSDDDKMVLKIKVKEKPTGAFSLGGGYSSVNDLFFMASISQRNLFGRGQVLELKGEFGGTSTRYSVGFTEPWLFDIPLLAGADLYDVSSDYDTYNRDSQGVGLRLGYPVYEFTRAYLNYSFENSDIKNITPEAPDSIKEVEGINVTSSIAATLQYDSRDRIFNPTEGSDHRATVIYAGDLMGGDISYTKYLVETGWYLPVYQELVGFVHGKTGYVRRGSTGFLPDYERFYLGGMNSVRGFYWRDISSKDNAGVKIGGNKFVQFNFELLYPILKKAGVVFVLFHDTGNVYNNTENIEFGNMRKSAGFGFRWFSPVGPIRLEYAVILDARAGEPSGGRWDFSMGAAF